MACAHTVKAGPCSSCLQPIVSRAPVGYDKDHARRWRYRHASKSRRHFPHDRLQAIRAGFIGGIR